MLSLSLFWWLNQYEILLALLPHASLSAPSPPQTYDPLILKPSVCFCLTQQVHSSQAVLHSFDWKKEKQPPPSYRAGRVCLGPCQLGLESVSVVSTLVENRLLSSPSEQVAQSLSSFHLLYKQQMISERSFNHIKLCTEWPQSLTVCLNQGSPVQHWGAILIYTFCDPVVGGNSTKENILTTPYTTTHTILWLG